MGAPRAEACDPDSAAGVAGADRLMAIEGDYTFLTRIASFVR